MRIISLSHRPLTITIGSAAAYGFTESNATYNGTYTFWVDRATGTIFSGNL